MPIVFGGNVFGWTIDQQQGFNILDAFVERGFNAIDTADFYSIWAEGNQGGESETIIGQWLKQNPSKRDDLVLFTKVGLDMGFPGHQGLSKRWIMQGVEDSLKRLNTEYIDLYFAHWPDENTPYEETLTAFETLKQQGKIRAVGTSNLDSAQLQQSIEAAKNINVPHYQVLQPEYNLYDRQGFEQGLKQICIENEIGVTSYYSLASGFLSGKYREINQIKNSQRANSLAKYFNPRGERILTALDIVAETHQSKVADVAVAWILAQEGITAPIASATSIEQLDSFTRAIALKLSDDDLMLLNNASSV
ncbi:aldo/keto reductase [Acinetobacter sp.]|uniref:aldo/keto reductase n=1 Tax=Acinetobacter sp. TaxID=472 RepID=UPI00388E3D74